ncbi:probable protein phosphatase 2C 27 isoform X2 [Cornus florida]|uniref:probable protein phosphatase 2C 27 isoform X2 n=1 Tax=Cornus florida TaxID=4283 RepID=UPI00289FBC7E|nr:probable protein phosphatase 2C 27 isoform X2 [Cornus florida]
MCLQDSEQVSERMDNLGFSEHEENHKTWPLQSELFHAQIQNWENEASCDQFALGNSFPVFDGHGGKFAAQFVRDHLPRVIVEDANFPLELEKIVTRSFMETDAAFAKSCSLESALSSGTTALTAMIFGRSLLVANAGDCRAVLSRRGLAIEMSKDHRPCCDNERMRIESLGGFIDDGYLNGQLGVTRALGDWHIKGLKETGERSGPLSAVPELKLITLTKEDEFLIIGSDGIWDAFRSQNAVDFARRKLQEHNDVKLCCKELVEEALKRGAIDNLTVVMVCFHSESPPRVTVPRPRVRRSISAEGLQNLKFLLEG